MAHLWNKITTNILLVKLLSYIIKTRPTAVSTLVYETKNFYPHFWQKMGKYGDFQRPANLLTPMGLFHFICSVDF